jgi:hypothetical protein
MAGIVAALKARDDIGALRQPVDDLALALVAPLGAHDNHIGHSAVRHVDGKAAQRGFLVLFVHVMAGLAHGLDTGVEADKVLAIAAQASEAAETALIAPRPFRSMQGTCTRPFTGSQVMPR